MDKLIDTIKNAGIVGAGGAGFPTHVKVDCKADYVIANGAECEPLLRVDQQIMACQAALLVKGLLAVGKQTGAKHLVIALKAHYKDAIAALEKEAQGTGIEIRQFKSFYPLGDEQTLVYEITGKVVPTGGLPLDVGAVVSNVSTLVQIAQAMDGRPVTHRYLTVGGEVERPLTTGVPVGAPIKALLELAGAPQNMEDYVVVIGGPCMGKVTEDLTTPVTKTTSGLLVFPKNHALIVQKTRDLERDMKLARAVCCQCSLCTQLCPRNAMGLNVQPHKAMRAVAYESGELMCDANGIFSCCDCGICSYYACNFGLSPSFIMQQLKQGLMAKGIKPTKEVGGKLDSAIGSKRLPTSRLIGRLNLKKYNVPAPLEEKLLQVRKVSIPLKMHIGAPAEPVVAKGAKVRAGDLIGKIKDGSLGACVHASIDGTVTSVGQEITIEA